MKGTLYVVATPIGNLEDISQRALKILSAVDIIAAEDTRHTRKLLSRHEIHPKKLMSYHEHNEREKLDTLLAALLSGQDVALVSDAGTPTVSDPGFPLVRRCVVEGVPIVPIPGPAALLSALSVSGIPTHAFYFAGFPPPKGSAKKRFFESLATLPSTLIFYESPHRVVKTINLMRETFGGDRFVTIAREMTKIHEEFSRGTLEELSETLSKKKPRGEYVIVLEGKTRKSAKGPSVPGAG